ncbi:unnamed protein product [marine sediment metagenome]|uniref:Uncharacterized protein n=1 Tax=marine sediment metagenome TaxID=412755 RepID=X1SN11_9ZZZZ
MLEKISRKKQERKAGLTSMVTAVWNFTSIAVKPCQRDSTGMEEAVVYGMRRLRDGVPT